MKEKELLQKFKKFLISKGVDKNTISISEGNKSKRMDFNFVDPITNSLISLEAKTFLDARTSSNFFLSLFGKILKGRYLNSIDPQYKNIKNIDYGFLFNESDKDKIDKLMTVIDKDDWVTFCNNFNLKYIYLVNDEEYIVHDSVGFINKNKSDAEYFNDDYINEFNEEDEMNESSSQNDKTTKHEGE